MKKNILMTTKTCKFPNCTETFEVEFSQTRYCEEHRQTKYRKYLPKKHKREYSDDNLKLITEFDEVKVIKKKCAVEDCPNEYEITIYPNQTTYCNFCEIHRNPYKRTRSVK